MLLLNVYWSQLVVCMVVFKNKLYCLVRTRQLKDIGLAFIGCVAKLETSLRAILHVLLWEYSLHKSIYIARVDIQGK